MPGYSITPLISRQYAYIAKKVDLAGLCAEFAEKSILTDHVASIRN